MKNLFITLLLFVLSCAMLHGQTKPRLAVWLKSGEKVYFELDAEPETTFSGSYMIIKTQDSTYCLLDDECLLFNYTIIKLL